MLRRTEYKEKRESIVVSGWGAAKMLAFNLLEGDYQVAITRQKRHYSLEYEYHIDFIHPEYDGVKFEITGDYEEEDLTNGSVLVTYKQKIGSVDWNGAEQMAQALVDNDYHIYIWTDGETFGGTMPKNYTIHFARKDDAEHKIRLVE